VKDWLGFDLVSGSDGNPMHTAAGIIASACGGGCSQRYTAVWDCVTRTWSGPTAGAKRCAPATPWTRIATDGLTSTYAIDVASATACSVDADCASITTTPPALPPGDGDCTPPVEITNCPESEDVNCCATYTTTFGGGSCVDGTYDLDLGNLPGGWADAGGNVGLDCEELSVPIGPGGSSVVAWCWVLAGPSGGVGDGCVCDDYTTSAFIWFVPMELSPLCPPTSEWQLLHSHCDGPVPSLTITRSVCP
jgi:hypothetical protein